MGKSAISLILLLLGYCLSYGVLRLNGVIIHGIHDNQHIMEYHKVALSPIFEPLMFVERFVHNVLE